MAQAVDAMTMLLYKDAIKRLYKRPQRTGFEYLAPETKLYGTCREKITLMQTLCMAYDPLADTRAARNTREARYDQMEG